MILQMHRFPTLEVLNSDSVRLALRRFDGKRCTFAILSKGPDSPTYIQSAPGEYGGYILEYQEESPGDSFSVSYDHYYASGGPFIREIIEDAFCSYVENGTSWRDKHKWILGFAHEESQETPSVNIFKIWSQVTAGTDAVRARLEQQRIDRASLRQEDAHEEAIVCPVCGSQQLHVGKRGYSAGAGAVGAVVAGPIGLLAGALGGTDLFLTCLNCGHKWRAGTNRG